VDDTAQKARLGRRLPLSCSQTGSITIQRGCLKFKKKQETVALFKHLMNFAY